MKIKMNSWMRIGSVANDKVARFNNLLNHISLENLREAFQAMDGTKATGMDNKTKKQYSKFLEENLKILHDSIHKGTYRPLARRQVLIPKTDGKMRPIAISAFEDKLIEWVVAKILSLIYEPLFIKTSYGFRPRRGAHDALQATYESLKDNKRPYVVEIDLKSYFDTVPHGKLIKLLAIRIADQRFISLIARLLKAGIMQDAQIKISDTGTAQGAIASPILANVYLHYCLDEWFLRNYSAQDAVIIRYADDAVFLFRTKAEAQNFKEELTKNLEEYRLSLNEDKSGIVDFSKSKGNVFHFLGFTLHWSKDYKAKDICLKFKTEKQRLFKKIGEFTEWIKAKRHKLSLDEIWKIAVAKIRGHYNYYGVVSNRSRLNMFYQSCVGSLFKWLNRRSQRKSFTWKKFARRLSFKPLPTPPPAVLLKPLRNDLLSTNRTNYRKSPVREICTPGSVRSLP